VKKIFIAPLQEIMKKWLNDDDHRHLERNPTLDFFSEREKKTFLHANSLF
jgi:hypothetical protein